MSALQGLNVDDLIRIGETLHTAFVVWLWEDDHIKIEEVWVEGLRNSVKLEYDDLDMATQDKVRACVIEHVESIEESYNNG